MPLTTESTDTLARISRGECISWLSGDRLTQDLMRHYDDEVALMASRQLMSRGYMPTMSAEWLWAVGGVCCTKDTLPAIPETEAEWDEQNENRTFLRALAIWGNRKFSTIARRAVDTGIISPQLLNSALLPEREEEDWVKELADVVNSELRTVVKVRGTEAIRQVGLGAGFNLQNTRVMQYLGDTSRIIGRRETDRYRAKLRQALMEGFDAGETAMQTAKRIEAVGERFVPWRAQMVSRTETAFAGTAGREMGWMQSSVVVGKRFALAPGGCPWCESAAAELGGLDDDNVAEKVVKLGQPFFTKGTELAASFTDADGNPREGKLKLNYSPSGGDLVIPPVHPHCRCDLVPVTYDEITG
jgi:hypothetical protein